MKKSESSKTSNILVFAWILIVYSITACGNNASVSDIQTPEEKNHETMNHDAHPAPESHNHTTSEHSKAKSASSRKNGFDGMPASGTKAFCPVMENGFEVTPNSTYSVYKGKTYVFCCPGCKPAFEKDPEKYIGKLQETL